MLPGDCNSPAGTVAVAETSYGFDQFRLARVFFDILPQVSNVQPGYTQRLIIFLAPNQVQ